MAVSPGWSLRQAALLADVSRATARGLAELGLIPHTGLELADLITLKAQALARTLVFEGETAAANAPRPVRDREKQLTQCLHDLLDAAADGRPTQTAVVLLYADSAHLYLDAATLIPEILTAQSSGRTFLAMPCGRWLTELQAPSPAPAAPENQHE